MEGQQIRGKFLVLQWECWCVSFEFCQSMCISLIEYLEYGVLSRFDTIYMVAPTSCKSLQNSLALTLWMLITVGSVLTVVGNLTFGVSNGVLNITLVSTQLMARLCCSNQS